MIRLLVSNLVVRWRERRDVRTLYGEALIQEIKAQWVVAKA